MSGIKNAWLRRGARVAAAVCVMLAAVTAVYAAPAASVLEQRVTEDSVLLYVRHGGGKQAVQAHIGTEANVEVNVADGDLPVVTWLLMDNSLSINDADRERARQLLTDLVAGRAPNERFNLCTFSDKLTVLAEDSQSYTDLKAQIDGLEHVDQNNYLTDVLVEILDREKAREGDEFVRIVVISDGVENNPNGLTKEELVQRLKEQAVPIYTLGSRNRNNEESLQAMYALSRQTNGLSWTLGDLSDTLEVVQVMSSSELPVCAEVLIPEKLRDGGTKGVQLTFDDGAVAETQVVMPFGTVTEPPVQEEPPAPAPPPAPAEPEKPGSSSLYIALAAVLAAVVIGVAVFFMLRRKKEQERIRPVEDSAFDFVEKGYTELKPDPSDPEDGGTVVLINSDRRLVLSLTDRADPSRHFEVPLRDKVSIGRSSANQVVLNYDKSVSGSHCEIFIAGSSFKIRDLNSRNGTCVDGVQVGDTAEISSGSVLKLGRVELTVEIR